DANLAAMRAMTELTGRLPPGLARLVGGARVGDFRAVPAGRSMTSHVDREGTMKEALCKSLGLPVTATDEQIQVKISALTAGAAQTEVLRAQLADSGREVEEARRRAAELAAQSDATHVESEITRLRGAHQVSDQVVETLRTTAAGASGRAAFDAA